MHHTKRILVIGAAAVLAFAPGAFSQEAEYSWMSTGTQTFSVVAGGQFFDIGDQLDLVGTDLQTELNVGARYQFSLTPHVGLEANVLFSPSNFDFVGPDLGPRDVNALYYNGNLVYNILPDAPVIPYLTGGAGAVSLFVDNPGNNVTDTKFVGNFGAGLLFPVGDRFGLRIDVRDYVYRIDNLDESFANELSVPPGFEETVNDVAVTGGFSILF